MTKIEKERCAEMLSCAIDYAKQANDELEVALESSKNHDAVTNNTTVRLCQWHNGLAIGIHDTLVVLNFKHPDMDELEKLLCQSHKISVLLGKAR